MSLYDTLFVQPVELPYPAWWPMRWRRVYRKNRREAREWIADYSYQHPRQSFYEELIQGWRTEITRMPLRREELAPWIEAFEDYVTRMYRPIIIAKVVL